MDQVASPLATDYHGVTTIHPLGLAIALLMGLALLLAPRRYAVWPMIATACLVASAQRIILLGLDFDLLRIMVLFGTARVFLRNEWRGFSWRPVDAAVLAWAITGTIAYTMLYSSVAAFKFKLGANYDAVGMYFLFRFLIRDWVDVRHAIVGFAFVSIPVAIAFAVEWSTARNMFAIFGGVREITWVREGRMRCQGAFSHPILAGTFWAAVLPLVAAMWWQGSRWRLLVAIQIPATLFIVFASGSATPVMGVAFAVLGGAVFFVRQWMSALRWTLLSLLVLLHLVMIAPVWHLVARVSVVGGSTGWHRFHLMDEAIDRVSEWWLIGTTSTGHWGYGLEDVTNQFVLEGVRGGLLTLLLFVAIIALSFRHVGMLVKSAEGDRPRQVLAWALGVSLFVHVASFIGVSYFGQIHMLWYLSLAMITGVTPQVSRQLVRRSVVSIRPADVEPPVALQKAKLQGV